MTPPRLAVAALGVIAGVGSLAVNLTSEVEPPFVFTPYLGLLVGWSFIAGGLIAWSRRADRPERRIGALMVATGFAWFAAVLTRIEVSLVASVGSAVSGLWTALAIYLASEREAHRSQDPLQGRQLVGGA